jgi:hypothetical protein
MSRITTMRFLSYTIHTISFSHPCVPVVQKILGDKRREQAWVYLNNANAKWISGESANLLRGSDIAVKMELETDIKRNNSLLNNCQAIYC